MKPFVLILLSSLSIVCQAQITFYIDDYIAFPDLKIKIGEETTLPDIKIQIGEDIVFDDFTVGITDIKSQADFIILDSKFKADKTIKASVDESFPDIRIKAGANITSPDLRIKMKPSGQVDYKVYTENSSLSVNELIIALLPAINKKLENKLDGIPELK